MNSNLSTGISGLDGLVGGLRPGDSVFWRVDEASHYWEFAKLFARACKHCGREVVCITWCPEDKRYYELIECDSSFCFDPAGNTEEQLDAFLGFAAAHASDCFVLGVPPPREDQKYEEFRFIRLLGKVFAQLFWLDCTSYFGHQNDQFGDEGLTILRDIPRILIQLGVQDHGTTLRILKAPGRPLVDTQVVYALRGEELVAVQPGEPTLADFKGIVERSQNVAWLLGLNDELVYVSRGALGLSRDELLTTATSALFRASDSRGAARAILGGMVEALRTHRAVTSIETLHVHRKTGNEGYFVHNIVPLYDKEDRPYGFLGTSTDVTELRKRERLLKESEVNLRASEEMFRSLVRQAGLGIVYFGAEGEYLDANDALCRMTGYSREELMASKASRPYSPGGYVSEHLDQVKGALAGRINVIETVFKRKNGELFPVRIHPSPITDHTGKQVGIIGIMEDLTAWKELEQEVIRTHRMDVASFLAVGIAHEFNNLHGGIQNLVELILEDKTLPGHVRKDLQVILKTLHRASGITRQLDKFARRLPPHKEPASLLEVVGDTLDLLHREYESEGIRIELKKGRKIPELAMDSAQIGQVLLNLFINARDAMRGRTQKILRVETGVSRKRVFVKVSDTGVGIARAHLEHIFEPVFTTKNNVDGKDAHGLGLGLAVCKTVVEEHGGEIEVSSAQGVGTTFTVWLPAEIDLPESPAVDGRTRNRADLAADARRSGRAAAARNHRKRTRAGASARARRSRRDGAN